MAVESTKRIFSAFLIVHFDKAEDTSSHNAKAPRGPVIDYSWPSGELLTDDEKHKIKSAADFAVPFHGYVPEKEAVETFTFTLTSGEYDKTYGFCRYSPSLGKCLCILSSNQWFEFFYSLLDHLARHVVEKNKDPEPVCQRLSTLEMHETGQVHEITLTELGLGIWKVHEIPSPHCLPKLSQSRNLLEYYSAASASPDTMIAVFTMLLLERSIVFFASKLGRLTACIHAATSLLYPLSWQHVIIPIVPYKLLQVLDCPSPSIFGVVKGLQPEVHKMFKNGMGENLVEVDLDKNEIFCPEDMEICSLPFPVHHMLQESLKSMMLNKKGRLRSDPWQNDNFARCFMDTIVALIGSYRSGFSARSGDSCSGDIDPNFYNEGFFASRPEEYRPFLKQLVATHHFQLFFEDRRNRLNLPNPHPFPDPFEKAAFDFTLPPTPPAKKLATQIKFRSKKFADVLTRAGKGVHGMGLTAIEKLKQRKDSYQRKSDMPRSGSVPELSDSSKTVSDEDVVVTPRVHATSGNTRARVQTIDGNDREMNHDSMVSTDTIPRRYEVIAVGDNVDSVLYSSSLLDDPELQSFLRKSKSAEDLLDDDVPSESPPPPPSGDAGGWLHSSDDSRRSSVERPRPRAPSRDAPVLPKPQRPPPPVPDQRPLSRIILPPAPEVQPRPKPRTKPRTTTLRQELDPSLFSSPARPIDPILERFDPLREPKSEPMPDLVVSAQPHPESSVYYSVCSETYHTPRSSAHSDSLLDMDNDSAVAGGRPASDDSEVFNVWLAQQKAANAPPKPPPPVPKPRSGSASSASQWVKFD